MRKPTPWWSTFPAILIWGLLFFRFTLLAVHSFIPFSLPETWRQTITMGAAARYWNRWTVEPPANQWLPAVLESGDSNGVMPMEFPILNFVVAPSFSFGIRPGHAIARLWLVLISLLLTVWNARLWRGRKYQGVELSKAMWLLPIISLGGDWVGKFMPDFVSMMLVLLAVAHSWERPRYLISFFLCALGLLMKPTSIAVLPFFLLSPHPRKIFIKTLVWSVPAIAVALLYYTAGLDFIRRYQELPDLYYLQRRPFFTALWEYFSNWKPVLRFIMGKFYFAGGLFLVLIGLAAASLKARSNRFTSLWFVLLLQMIPVAGAAGAQAIGHEYYFISLTPTLAVLFLFAFQECGDLWLRGLMLLGLSIRLLDLSYIDLRPLLKPHSNPEWTAAEQCVELIKRTPQFPWKKGIAFRSSAEDYPFLGVCFGERQASKTSAFGFFWKRDAIPQGCQSVEETENLRLVTCSDKNPK